MKRTQICEKMSHAHELSTCNQTDLTRKLLLIMGNRCFSQLFYAFLSMGRCRKS